MSEKEKLLREIAQQDFVLWELQIFLDAQPTDKTALAMYQMNKKKYDELVAQYTSKYGPLNTKDVTKDNKWVWVSDPWPWDLTSEGGL